MAEMDNVRFRDIINLGEYQQFQDSMAAATGFALVTVDDKGQQITRPSGGDVKGLRDASSGVSVAVNESGGMFEISVPASLSGKRLGAVLGCAACDKKVAKGCADAIYAHLNAVLGGADYQVQFESVAGTINDAVLRISTAMEELATSAHDVDENQKGLNEEIRNVNDISSKINEFTGLIRDIAKQTRLLGLNASIEAARAGTAGAGFAVVSEEIGKLADSSRETVDKIQEFTDRIGESVNETVAKGEATSKIVEQQSSSIAGVADELGDLSVTAAKLVELVGVNKK